MQKILIGLFLTIILVLSSSSVSQALTWEINEISTTANNFSPQIDGSKVVWAGADDYTADIYLYDINTGTAANISNNSETDSSPQISGNNVTWYGSNDYDISFYNGTEVTNITNSPGFYDLYPEIDGSKVVWGGRVIGTSVAEIYLYDYSTGGTTNLSNTPDYGDVDPRISGNYVVWNGGSSSGQSQIYGYNGTAKIQITNNLYSNTAPQISGNYVTWKGYYSGNYLIGLYDFSTGETTNIYSGTTWHASPQIGGHYVTWLQSDGVYLYDIETTNMIQLSTNYYSSGYNISGNNVVWCEYESINPDPFDPFGSTMYKYEIFFYDGSNVTQITDNGETLFESYSAPVIDGNNVVWTADRAVFLAKGLGDEEEEEEELIPEPASLLLLGMGVLGIGLFRRRRLLG